MKKKWCYYASYHFKAVDGRSGFGGCDMSCDEKIDSPKRVGEVAKAIRDKNGFSSVILAWWKLLRVEEE